MLVEFLVIIGIIFISLLLVIVFIMPSETKNKRKKKKSQAEEPSVPQRDWEQKALRLEGHVQSLRDQIFAYQKKDKANAKKMMVEQVKVKKFQEKLSQERQWHIKEQNSIDKRGKELQQLKGELANVQENFSKAHSMNLQLGHQLKDLEQQNSSLNEQRRSVEGENAQLKTRSDDHRREIAHLKKENMQLSRKKEDLQWVAKSEYERVVNLLKEKEKAMDRIIRESRK